MEPQGIDRLADSEDPEHKNAKARKRRIGGIALILLVLFVAVSRVDTGRFLGDPQAETGQK